MRLFVALDLPDELRRLVADLAGRGLPGARWIAPENYHITLRFIGEVVPHVAEEIDLALANLRARGFSLELAGVAIAEKSGRPSSLRLGVARNPALEHLRGKIETALQRIGLPPERRRFTPHVTLARVDQVAEARLGAWLGANNLFRAPAFAIEHFTLFSSRLGKEQSHYTAEVEYTLA